MFMNELKSPRRAESKKPMIMVLLDNLFFAAKISHGADQSGLRAVYAKNPEEAVEIASAERPSLIIMDLDATKCSPFVLLNRFKADEKLKSVPIVGFVSHVNTGVQQEAREAGCDRVLVRSVFDRNLVSIFDEILRAT